MNERLRTGKGNELVVAAKLIENGIDIFLPLIDRCVDRVIQMKDRFYGVQVKSVEAYNRIIGLSTPPDILIIHYKHKGDRKDEFLYLTKNR